MKCLYLIMISFLIVFVAGCNDNTGSSKDGIVTNLQNENQKLRQELVQVKQSLTQAIQERDSAQEIAKSRYVTLATIAYIALGIGIILIAGFFYLVFNSRKKQSIVDNTHCPRCGWKHDINETTCKNCKTHF